MTGLSGVDYTHWDNLRGAIYDMIAWWIKNESLLDRTAEIVGTTPDQLLIRQLEKMTENMDNICKIAKRGDEI